MHPVLQEFQKYLHMGKHNPVLARDNNYIRAKLDSLLAREEIDVHEYHVFISTLNNIQYGALFPRIEKAFTMNDTIRRVGFRNLNISDKELTPLLNGRKVSELFIKWNDPINHRPNNPDLLNYLMSLAKEVGKYLQEKDERLWENLLLLEYVTLGAVRRDQVSRLQTQTIGLVIKYAREYAETLLGNLPEDYHVYVKDENPLAEIDFPFSEGRIELLYTYITHLTNYDNTYKKYSELLKEKLDGMGASTELRQKANDWLYNNGYLLSIINDKFPYKPLLDLYSALSNRRDLRCMYFFTQGEVRSAVNYASKFIALFTDEFLINFLLEKKLKVNLLDYGDTVEVREKFRDEIYSALEMFLQHGIITEAQNKEYVKQVKERFL